MGDISIINKENFCPRVITTIKVGSNIGFNYGANAYYEKNDILISCPSNSSIYFIEYDKKKQKLMDIQKSIDSSVVQMSYCTKTSTYLMGCAKGHIYAYDAIKKKLRQLNKHCDKYVLAICHINHTMYAFSCDKTNDIFFSSTNNRIRTIPQYSKNSYAWYLHHDDQQKLLYAGLANGNMIIYNTNIERQLNTKYLSKNPPKYRLISCIQAHTFGKYVTAIKTITINKQQYIVTGGNDQAIKIFKNMNGKLKLLKVIQNERGISNIAYLEHYKMIAVTQHDNYIKFYTLPFGKLRLQFNANLTKIRSMFLMNNKNCIGVADLDKNLIKIIQLHSS